MRINTRALPYLACLLFRCAVAWPQEAPPRVVHVFVALADNAHQGIVPVPPRLGNGDDPERNLYWGASYGVKTFFARSAEWHLEASLVGPRAGVHERCVFRHRSKNVLLIADAYQGSQIQQAILDFLQAATGESGRSAPSKNAALHRGSSIGIPDKTDLVVYVGHEGLMDFSLPTLPHKKKDARAPEAIVLACVSKSYFWHPLLAVGAKPLLWTTSLMAPEAYTLKSALDGWVLGESSEQIRERAAVAYSKYQHCSPAAAKRLLVTGF